MTDEVKKQITRARQEQREMDEVVTRIIRSRLIADLDQHRSRQKWMLENIIKPTVQKALEAAGINAENIKVSYDDEENAR